MERLKSQNSVLHKNVSKLLLLVEQTPENGDDKDKQQIEKQEEEEEELRATSNARPEQGDNFELDGLDGEVGQKLRQLQHDLDRFVQKWRQVTAAQVNL